MALNASNNSNLEHLALTGLTSSLDQWIRSVCANVRSQCYRRIQSLSNDRWVTKITSHVNIIWILPNSFELLRWCSWYHGTCSCLLFDLLLRPGRGAEYCDRFVCLSVCVCLSASISLERWTDFHEFLCRSPVAVARSSSGVVAIRYVLPVLWMTSRLAVVGRMGMRGRLNLQPTTTSGVVIPGRSLKSMNVWMACLICVCFVLWMKYSLNI